MRLASLQAAREFGLDVPELDAREPKRSPSKSREDLFAFHCKAHSLPAVERQYLFAKSIGRRWMFDFAFVPFKVAVEVEGLVMRRLAGQLVVMGRHASPTGIKSDMEKYNTACLLGWYVLRFDQNAIKPGLAVEMTSRVLQSRGWSPGKDVLL